MTLAHGTSKIRDLFLKQGLVNDLQMRTAIAHLDRWGGRLPKILSDLGFTDEDTATEILAKSLGVPVEHLGLVSKDVAALAKMGEKFCVEYAVFPISLKNRTLVLAMADPTALDVVDLAGARCNARVQVVAAAESEINAAIARHFRGQERATPRHYHREAVEASLGTDVDPTETLRDVVEEEVPESRRVKKSHDVWGSYVAREEVFEFEADPPSHLKAARQDDSPLPGIDEELSVADNARVAQVVANQAQTSAILRALTELLRAKGYGL